MLFLQLVNYVILLTEIAFIHKRLSLPSLSLVCLPFSLIFPLSVSQCPPYILHSFNQCSHSQEADLLGWLEPPLCLHRMLISSVPLNSSVKMPEFPPYPLARGQGCDGLMA